MPETYVAIDLETTGFDATSDRIIEIGAVRFDRAGRVERFGTFVRPDRPIPSAVQTLTAIHDADVAHAPRVEEVLPELARFVEGCAVIGHNVQFDLGFLAAAGLPIDAPSYDTYDLASALLPTANRMQLGAIADTLGISMPVAHRALADADATREVFLSLLGRLDALPRSVLLDLLAIAEQGEWPVLPLVAAACARAEASAPLGADSGRELAALVVAPAGPLPAPLVPVNQPQPVTEQEVETLFAFAAAHPELLPGFELRAAQTAMARAVARNLAASGHLAVEAGTGTGKSLAYLMPALLHALRNDDRVVVSTHTLNLQEQLALHDLPDASAVVETFAGAPRGTLRSAVLKGRSNYLCLERWAEVRANGRPRNRTEARLHARIAVWLPTTETGELGEIAVPAAERSAWDALSSQSNDCLSRRCAYVRDNSCFLLRARARAAASHLVVVNHALLLANAASGDQVLPPYRHLVVDEAHRLEGVATQQYGLSLSLRALQNEVEGLSPLLGRLREFAFGRGDEALSPAAGLTGISDSLAGAGASVLARIPDLDGALRSFVAEFAEQGRGGPERTVPVTAGRRAQPLWDDVEEAGAQLDVTLQHCAERIASARGTISSLGSNVPAVERVQGALGALAEAVLGARTVLHEAVLRADASRIVWLVDTEGGVRVEAAPLEVAERLASDLYAGRESVTVTSATLTTQGTFDFTVDTMGLLEPDTLAVPSPFDYRSAVLTLVVDDIPTPEAPGYAEAVHRVLASAAEAAGGRTLALFTSHAAVRGAAGALVVPLAARGIGVLAQGVDGAPGRLLRTLVEQPRTMLLGTAAFWEGVDVRGDTLSQIAIARLPFPVPSDPIYAGRAALYDDPFNEYALPQAVLRFRQGFGRLIRGRDERGVFLLLDRRVIARPYGEAFLDALPDCEVRRVPASAVANAVAAWLT
jgi:DNA polymerase III epsilon subunit family exonuclease